MTDFQEALPRPNPFDCCASRHLWQSGLALAIYEKIGQLTSQGQRLYFADTAEMASFFSASKTYVRRQFSALHRAGFLIVVDDDESKRVKRTRAIKRRRWIHHKDWAKANPGKCLVVDEKLMPWSADSDPLCGQLWAALEGKMRMYESLIKHARSCGRPDNEIVAAIAANWRAAQERKARKDYNRVSAKSVFFDTIKALSSVGGASYK